MGPLVLPTIWFRKDRPLVESFTAGSPPLSFTICVPPGALSVMVIAPVRAPATEGVNVTLIWQFFPEARLVVQLLVCPKSPLAVIPEICSGATPGLLSNTVCSRLVTPTDGEAKDSLLGETPTTGESKNTEIVGDGPRTLVGTARARVPFSPKSPTARP
jgi:hypothetical protein